MHEEMRLPEELREVEAALGGLAPAGHGIDRDGLMFAAGVAAGLGAVVYKVRLWKGLCGVLMVAVVGLAVLSPISRVEKPVVVKHETGGLTVAVRSEADSVPAPMARETLAKAGDGDGYLTLRRRVERVGLSALPEIKGGGGGSGGGAVMKEALDGMPMWRQRAELLTGGES